MPIQWLISLFALFAAYKAVTAFRASTIDRRKLLYWMMFWIVALFVIWLPQSTSTIASYLGVGRGVDVVLYVSIVVLFYSQFQLSRKVDRLERSLTDLVRALALKNFSRHDK